MSTSTLTPQILGQAENAHRALLDRVLARSSHSYQEWLALSLGAAGGDDGLVRLTDEGRTLHAQLRAAIGEIVARLYRDLPADELEAAGRVLTVITERANQELAGS